mmetsp:Transcript_6364/g.9575  ORF Transcript_6364/g.9575 Transcript_6364/m.9575 type:complete len:84 (-) Transcript_6364:63-314(-)
MLNAHSITYNTSDTSLYFTGLALCSMLIADSSSDDLVCASFARASFDLGPVPDTHTSFLDNIGTPISRAPSSTSSISYRSSTS